MALSILDGTQTATTLSTILSSGQHITAHTVVSLGTQAITDMRGAVSGSVVSISNFPATQTVTFSQAPVTFGLISGTVALNGGTIGTVNGLQDGEGATFGLDRNFPVDVMSPLPAGTNRIGVVTIGAGTVTLGASTSQIGSVTASISNSLTISSLPAISGTVTANVFGKEYFGNTFVPIQIGASGYNFTNGNRIGVALINDAGTEFGTTGDGLTIAGTVTANTFAVQGTAVTTSNFTSTTASTVLANYNATREVLTIFNEGAGNLHICAGATCTTIAYQVRLSAGDYYEVPNHQTTITHSAVFATAGTARVTQVS